jgi:nucleoside-diphosphate-sugar epimerase
VSTLGSDVPATALASGRVLVTGATGFLGSSLLGRLLDGGVQVRALVRSPTKVEALAEQGVETVVGDISDRDALAIALDDVAVVYHLAGKLLEPGEPDELYHRTHVGGTKLLIEACQHHPKLERLVHCSTTGVLGTTGDEPLDESAPFRPTNIYEVTKAEAETTIRREWQDRLPAVIVRPGLVYGPGDLHLLKFFRSVLRRRFRPIGRRTIWLHPIYIDDMTEALLRCGLRPAALGECFHIAGPEPVPLERLAETIAQAVGTTLPHGRIPLPAAWALAVGGDSLPARLKLSAPLTRSRLEFLTHSRMYTVDKAKRLLDFVAPTELSTGITCTVAWYREHGYLPASVPRAA